MSWVKKGNVVSLLVAAALVALFLLVFLDPLLKRALIAGAQAAAGAKVEVGSLRTSLLRGRLSLRSVAVADKNRPMRNLVEFDAARFELKPSAALRARAVIREASVEGLRFGTARRRSGALPRKSQPSKLAALARSAVGPVATEAATQTSLAVSGKLDPEKLKSLAGLDEAEAKAKDVETRWKARLESFKDLDRRLAQVRESLASLGKGGGSPAEIAARIKAAQEAQQTIRDLQSQVASARQDLDADLGQVKAAAAKAEELKDKDLRDLMAAAGLPSFDAESLTRRLLGPELASRVATALDWARWAMRKSAAAAPKAAPPARRRGVDVAFPRPGDDPRFLLEKASLSGRLAGRDGAPPVSFSGALSGVTDNPPLYGKPARLSLAGASGPVSLSLDGSLDRTREPGTLLADFSYAGIPLSGLELGEGQLAAAVADGRARARGRLKLQGERWDGEVSLDASGLRLEPKVELPGPAGRAAASALRGLSSFQARVGLSGTGDDLKFTLSSDLGQALAAAMRQAAGEELAAQRRELEKKLDALYGERAQALRARMSGLTAELSEPLRQRSQLLEAALKDAASKAAGGGLDKVLKGLFPRR